MNRQPLNQLVKKPTHWHILYVLFPTVSILLTSILLGFATNSGGEVGLLARLSPILNLVIASIITFVFISLLTRKIPTADDLGFNTKALSKRNVLIILAVFIITHAFFILAAKVSGATSNAQAEFTNGGFGNNFTNDLILIIAGTIIAPIFEEFLYRGVMLRSAHDWLLKKFPHSTSILGIPSVLSVVITAIAFIFPHVSNLSINVMTLAYFVSSAGFSLVFLLTGSLVAAMVSHSMQSCLAFFQILYFGHGSYALSPVIYGIACLCPIIVFLIGSLLQSFFRKEKLSN